ncbi:MAG: type II secretion system secretin GspD [Rhodocyclaceae bacterium]|nr:type II secretion system secretin GspD [Rhodocyclaceae bacterium]
MDESSVEAPKIFKGNDEVIRLPRAGAKRVTGEAVALRFEAAPITEVVHAVLGDMLKQNYTIHQPVAGEVTLHTLSPMPPEQILSVLESLLEANGLAIAQDSNGLYHVGRPEALKFLVPVPRRADRLPPGTSLIVVPLKFIGAPEMATILTPLATPQALVRVDALRNLLVLAGTRNQLDAWVEMVEMFDVDLLQGMSVGLFPLKNVSVSEVEAALQLMTGGASTPLPRVATPAAAPGGAAQAPAAASAASPIGSAFRVLPIERMNAILVVTPRAAYLDTAREWIEKLDRQDNDGSPRLYVYPVQHGSAVQLAGLLNGVFGGQASTGSTPTRDSGVAPGLGVSSMNTPTTTSSTGSIGSSGSYGSSGNRTSSARQANAAGAGGTTQVAIGDNVRVVADDEHNALLVYAPRKEYDRIESALRQLDRQPSQVLIEASIIEVQLTGELRYGLQWFFNNNVKGSGWSGSGQLGTGTSGGIVTGNAGFNYTLTNPLGDVRAVLNLLASKNLINVMSSPSLMVLDNQTAEFQVGNQQPVQGSSTVTDGGTTTNSITYRDTGVILSVTPSVNAGNLITMDLKQEVTDVGSDENPTGQTAFLKRQISSRIAVPSGETVVLGGLIQDRKTRGRQGVPVLNDIPVFGSLFGTTGITSDRTELLVLITPRVVRNEQDMTDVTREIKDRMGSLKRSLGEWAAPQRTMQERMDPYSLKDLAPADARE